MTKKLVIGLIQMRSEDSSDENLACAAQKVSEAAKRGAQIICLQELFKSHYFPQTKDHRYFKLAEPIPGPTTDLFSELANKLKVVLIVPIFEKENGSYFNSAAVIDADGKLLGSYRKTHLPNDPCFYEQFYFSHGNSGFKSFETKYARIGVLICWDQWFPEPARALADEDIQILFYPSAIGWIKGETKILRKEELIAWETIQRAHAIANGIYVASVNRVGKEGKLTFWGNSFVAGPFGEELASASSLREEIVIAKCDFSKISKVRKVWPFLASRRKDIYESNVLSS